MSSANSLKGRRILVLEDDFWVVMDLVQDLQEHGAEVVGPFGNIEQAMAVLDEGRPVEGAVLDVNVQGTPSYSIADALIERGIPVVFATGYDSSDLPETYRKIPILQKPVTSDQVLSKLGAHRDDE